jgi:lipopolysaccharide export system protein LptC
MFSERQKRWVCYVCMLVIVAAFGWGLATAPSYVHPTSPDADHPVLMGGRGGPHYETRVEADAFAHMCIVVAVALIVLIGFALSIKSDNRSPE